MSANFNDLVELMATLRSPNGCPWDREQNYASLAPMLLEEAYEAFEAVEEAREGNAEALRDELGDLLFQIIFYAQVAKERSDFTIDDVTDSIHIKMVRRHPHVFAGDTAENSEEVLKNWEAIKAQEKKEAGKDNVKEMSLLDGVSSKAPALMEAHQLSTKAARVGFDWKSVDLIFEKLHEEVEELQLAILNHQENSEESEARLREEVGDLLFVVTNIARHLKVEPEAALKLTNRKFRRRFGYIEKKLKEKSLMLDQATIDEMEDLWQESKSK
jgi:MazG family protein